MENSRESVGQRTDDVTDRVFDQESNSCLSQVTESAEILTHRISGVKCVLVIMSARGIVFDKEAMRHQIILTYPDAIVFFETTMGKPLGQPAPSQVDLIIDLTGPRQKQKLFYAKKLRRRARVVVGRNAGLFRKRIYDKIFDEIANASEVPSEMLAKERYVQKKVLALAGIKFVQAGETPPDRGKSIALELPKMQRL